MTPPEPYDAFTPPEASALVSFYAVGGTLYATVTAEAISSVEVTVIGTALREALEDAPEGSLRHLVVDLARVRYINSQAIGMLVSTHSSAAHRGAKLVLASVPEAVQDILDVVKVTRLLNVCADADELQRMLRDA